MQDAILMLLHNLHISVREIACRCDTFGIIPEVVGMGLEAELTLLPICIT